MTLVQAFSLEQASRLTGISVNQLRNWDRTGFFRPSLASENRREPFSRIYTFVDLASLKVISTLRNETKVSLQHLREVGKKLSKLGENKWASVTLYVLNKKVVFHNPETDSKEEIVSGQAILDIPLEVVRSNMQKAVDAERQRTSDEFGRLQKTRFVAHSQTVVAGTRIPVRAIVSFIKASYSDKQIIEEYPSLTVQDIDAIRKAGLAA
jgi:DNA-binding transcriptional MerR regulator